MAYAQANLSALAPFTVSGSWQMWVYRSADAIATVVGSAYITNASEMGMVVGDTVLVVDTATPTQSWHRVTVISAAGAGTLSAGLVIT